MLCPLAASFLSLLGKDSLLILVGVAFSSISFFLLSFASTREEIYLTAVLGLLIGGISPGYRSFLPRMVPKEQTARLLTVIRSVALLLPQGRAVW